MRFAFAGDREISVRILQFLIEEGHQPLALFVATEKKATHDKELIRLSRLDSRKVYRGKLINDSDVLDVLSGLNLDYIICVHFPYIVREKALSLPEIGVLNLHPAYLPYNKGWHTPSWAILDGTPYGATLHFMTAGIDEGDVIQQKQVAVEPDDTAHSLYQKVLKIEHELFISALPGLLSLSPNRVPQIEVGTAHNRRDLQNVAQIDLNAQIKAGDLIDKLRSLTTNDISEAAYFIKNNKKYAVTIEITELT